MIVAKILVLWLMLDVALVLAWTPDAPEEPLDIAKAPIQR